MVLFLSHGGNTPECVAAALQLVAKGVTMLTLTGNKSKLVEDCHMDALSDVAFLVSQPLWCTDVAWYWPKSHASTQW